MIACFAFLATLPSTWTVVCGGDLMFNGIRPSAAPLAGVARVMAGADLAVANLEIPLCSTRERTRRKSKEDVKAKRQFVLTADPGHAAALSSAGLDLVSLGNNHAMDAGPLGLSEMLGMLSKRGIGWTGAGLSLAEAETPAVKRLPNGVRVGLLSYLAFMGSGALWTCSPATSTSAGVASLPFGGTIGTAARSRVRAAVEGAKRRCDVLLVALHWGIEKQARPTAYQASLGRAFIEAGADAVLGSHPHVLQGVELLEGRPILYSMGNLVSPRNGETALYRLRFEGRAFQGVEIVPVRIRGGQASPVSVKERRAALARIEALDRLIPQRRPSTARVTRPAR